MTKEEQNAQIDYEWDKFCRRYPILTCEKFSVRLIKLFTKVSKNEKKEIWVNGFCMGQLKTYENLK